MIQAFAVRLRGSPHETIINSSSAGRAKSQYVRGCDLCDVRFTDVRVRRCGGPVTTADLVRVAEYRGVPFVRAGMRVQVGQHSGRIVAHNDSANFNVLFEDGPYAGEVLNCHPNWEITYFDDAGNVLAEFRR